MLGQLPVLWDGRFYCSLSHSATIYSSICLELLRVSRKTRFISGMICGVDGLFAHLDITPSFSVCSQQQQPAAALAPNQRHCMHQRRKIRLKNDGSLSALLHAAAVEKVVPGFTAVRLSCFRKDKYTQHFRKNPDMIQKYEVNLQQ